MHHLPALPHSVLSSLPPCSISGNDIEDLAWRLWSGAERPIIPPRVVALLIGLNNVQGRQLPGQTVGRLEEVVKYLQAAFPQTKLVLVRWGEAGSAPCQKNARRDGRAGTAFLLRPQRCCGTPQPLAPPRLTLRSPGCPAQTNPTRSLIPNAKFDHTALNTQYWTLSWRRGIAWAACGRDINPADPAQLYDGTHPTPLGIDKLMRCVAPHVYQLIRQTKGRAG